MKVALNEVEISC